LPTYYRTDRWYEPTWSNNRYGTNITNCSCVTLSTTDLAWYQWNNVTVSSTSSTYTFAPDAWLPSGGDYTAVVPTIQSASAITSNEPWYVIKDGYGNTVWESWNDHHRWEKRWGKRDFYPADFIFAAIAKRWASNLLDEAWDENARRTLELAERRAEALLRTLLSDEQWDSYVSHRAFEFVAPSGRRYRLREGWAGNVEEVLTDEQLREVRPGRPVRGRRFCIHPLSSFPRADNLVAQVLMLRNEEEEFLRLANVS